MQRGLVGSEMCIRDRYQRRVHGKINMNKLPEQHQEKKSKPDTSRKEISRENSVTNIQSNISRTTNFQHSFADSQKAHFLKNEELQMERKRPLVVSETVGTLKRFKEAQCLAPEKKIDRCNQQQQTNNR
eukprot:TRINITY_DN15907_c0_g1_i1.p1 TRINITY_DN15907_c0_g1~~TRINITY_DN15907_c0_g1_i1.p1  ORF type:complete len:129 (-),score=44.76 TRINITY_DN15907_c0_g1_i1:218-604(-)